MRLLKLYLFVFVSICFASCGGVSQIEYDALQTENDSLRKVIAQKECDNNSYLSEDKEKQAESNVTTESEEIPIEKGNIVTTMITATAGNIFYRGIQNPLSVAISGRKDYEVQATGGAVVTEGKVAGFEGNYIVTVPAECQAKEIIININADGKNICRKTFKVLNVPNPVIAIGGYKNGSDLPKSAINGSPRLDAVLEDGFFPFKDIKYSVTSFTYLKEVRGVTSSQVISGNVIPGDIISDMSKKASGSSISFIGIKVSSPSETNTVLGYTARVK